MCAPGTTNMSCAVSGGFATVQPNSVLSINAVEGYPLEAFSAEVCAITPLRTAGTILTIYRP